MSAVPSDFAWPRLPAQGLLDIPFINTAGAAMTPGQVVKLDTANALSPTLVTAPGMVLTTAVTDVADGVVVQDTAVNGQGSIQIGGIATVYQDSGGNIAVAALVGPSAAVAGEVTTATATAGDGLVGKAWSAGTASADPIAVRLILGTY
jgi:hypothetical protein